MKAFSLIVARDEGHLFLGERLPGKLPQQDKKDAIPCEVTLGPGVTIQNMDHDTLSLWSYQSTDGSQLLITMGEDPEAEKRGMHPLGTGAWIVHRTPADYNAWHDDMHG